MRFMILVNSNSDLEARLEAMSVSQMKDSMAAMEVFNEEIKMASVLKSLTTRTAACQLQPLRSNRLYRPMER